MSSSCNSHADPGSVHRIQWRLYQVATSPIARSHRVRGTTSPSFATSAKVKTGGSHDRRYAAVIGHDNNSSCTDSRCKRSVGVSIVCKPVFPNGVFKVKDGKAQCLPQDDGLSLCKRERTVVPKHVAGRPTNVVQIQLMLAVLVCEPLNQRPRTLPRRSAGQRPHRCRF